MTSNVSNQSAGALSLSLNCSAIPASNIASVEYIRGEEAISAPYVFEVTFTTFSKVGASGVIGQPIAVNINPGTETLVVNGIILSLFSGDPTLSGNFVYRIVVVPRLKLLDLNQRNQVFGTQNALTIKDVIPQLLDGQLDQQCSIANASPQTISNELRIYSNYTARSDIKVVSGATLEIQKGKSDLNAADINFGNLKTMYHNLHAGEKALEVKNGQVTVKNKSTETGYGTSSSSASFRELAKVRRRNHVPDRKSKFA